MSVVCGREVPWVVQVRSRYARWGLLLMVAGALGLVAGCGGGSSNAVDAGPELPAWSRELPVAAVAVGVRRGLTPVRGVIHSHTPYSHDACDDEPRDPGTGAVDEQCLSDLREGLCATRMGFAALTDHDDSMADEQFRELFLVRGEDQLVTNSEGVATASRLRCADGTEVLWYVGGENALMPIMLDRHPSGDAQQRHDAYNASDVAAVQLFRELGGLTYLSHTEQWEVAAVRNLAPDGIEIFNLHATIDPGLREDFLGLDGPGAIQAVAKFADQDPAGPEPDLALLAFVAENTPSVSTWNQLLGEGLRIAGSTGTDAHRNSLPIDLRDGERADSYRRMMRWMSNVALVEEPEDASSVEAAIAAGRYSVVFELFGTPAGYDVVAGDAELGDEVDLSAGDVALTVVIPSVYGLDPRLPTPEIRARVLALGPSGVRELAAGGGPQLEVMLSAADAAAAYRVEVLITPHHLGPYLGTLGPELAQVERVWIYSNPIYVAAP